MLKKFSLFILIFLFFGFLNTNLVAAQSSSQSKSVLIVNPIRGKDFAPDNFRLLETPRNQYKLIGENNLPATWLLRYDALLDDETVGFLKSLNNKQEIGVFLEVTPSLTKQAGVKYNESANWHYAKSVLLTGYSVDDRKLLMDTVFERYKSIFGIYPKSVGAWWIDANSLLYMKEKYKIEANLDVADQFSTDQYQVWGQYFSLPYFPSKNNALMPASSIDKKIGVVTVQWATRDPYNAYGNGVGDSTYSVQANDYLLHDLGINYFKDLVKIYPQVTVGLENDFSWKEFGEEYKKQINFLAEEVSKARVKAYKMNEFARVYSLNNPLISSSELIVADDPLGSGGKVVWYQTPRYRVGWFYQPERGSVIRDLRLYQDSVEEGCFSKPCERLNLVAAPSQALDEVNYSTNWLIDEGRITDFGVKRVNEEVEIGYKNQAGTVRKIIFKDNDIVLDDKVQPISFAILNASKNANSDSEKKVDREFISILDIRENLIRILIGGVKYIFLTILFFFVPGFVLTKKWQLSIPVGWVIFTLSLYYLNYGYLYFLTSFIPLVSIVYLLIKRKEYLRKINLRLTKKGFILFVGIIFGSFVWLLTTVKNGLLYNYGYGYWGAHGHDGIWHLTLISQLEKTASPQNPVFAGERLSNYHYFFDLLLAGSKVIFGIDSQDLLFRFFPITIAVLLGVLSYYFIRLVLKKLNYQGGVFIGGLLGLFFVYFGGSFGWVVNYFRKGDFGGESMFWAQQSISTLINPPFAISLVLILVSFCLIERFGSNFSLKLKYIAEYKLPLIALILVLGSLVEFKAYATVIVFGGLAIYALEKLIFKREALLFLVLVCAVILSFLIFYPSLESSKSLFVFKPFGLIFSMIVSPDRLGWERLFLAIDSGVGWKVVSGYLIGAAIFIGGNLGLRIFGLFGYQILIKERLYLYMIAIGLILPILFIQKGTNWNTVQFLYYSQFILALLTGICFGVFISIQKNKFISLVIAGTLILLTIPTTIDSLKHYLPNRPPARLTKAEFDALLFLRNQPDGVILTLPFETGKRREYREPFPLFVYESTAYVSAFSGKMVFLEDMVNLDILGVDYKGRLNTVRDFQRVIQSSKNILAKNNIQYVYVVRGQLFEGSESDRGLKKVYENSEVVIYEKNI